MAQSKNQKQKNKALLLALVAIVALIFLTSILKMPTPNLKHDEEHQVSN